MKKLIILITILLFAKNICAQNNSNQVLQLSNFDSLDIEIFNIDYSKMPDSISLFCTIKNKYKKYQNSTLSKNHNYGKYFQSVIEQIKNKDYIIENYKVYEYDNPEFTSSFVLDYSGSMSGDISNLVLAMNKVKEFIKKGKDNFNVVQFDHQVYNSIHLTEDTAQINNLVPFSELGGSTAFYQASFEGLTNTESSKKQKVVILFTDGQDNNSFISADDVVIKARKAGAKVYVIGYGGANIQVLSQIALQTGGKAYFPTTLNDLHDIFTEIYINMQHYYVVRYKIKVPDCNQRNVIVNFGDQNSKKLLTANRDYCLKPFRIEENRTYHFALFQKNSDKIIESYLPNIIKLADFLKNNPNKKISIYGHTDSFGNSFKQKDLSLRMAWAVKNILVKNGVDIDQLVTVDGLGFEKPMHKNDKDAEWMQQENRRVEVVFEN